MTEPQLPALRTALADVVAIPVTPFAADGSVDEKAQRAVLRRLLDAGVTTLTPNGNTGEFYALTPDEQPARRRADRRGGRGSRDDRGRGGSRGAHGRRRRAARARRGRPAGDGAPARAPVRRTGRLDRLSPGDRRRRSRTRRRRVHPQSPARGPGTGRARRPLPQCRRRQVRGPRRGPLRRLRARRRPAPLRLGGRTRRAVRALLLVHAARPASPRGSSMSPPPSRSPCATRCAKVATRTP